MPAQIYPFDNPANYNLNNVQVTGGVAKLGLVDKPSQVFANTIDDDTGFTYDSLLAEFTGGVVRQKDQTPTGSVLATTYAISTALDWNKNGSVTGTSVGAPTIVSGKLVCTGLQGVYYESDSATIESHKFTYKPNYTGAPPANVNLLSIENGTNTNDRFHLTNSPSGSNLRLTLYDGTGGVVIGVATTVAAWSPTAGVTYEFEVVIDSVAGTVRVFVDGSLLGTNTPGAWSRTVAANRFYIGAHPTFYSRAEGSFDDYIYFTNAQHTASYTPGYTLPIYLYSTSKVDGPNFAYTGLGDIVSLDTGSVSESGFPKYILGGKYWDGAAWSVSSGVYAQANDFATALANFATLDLSGGGGLISWSVVFPNSNSQSQTDSLSLEITGQQYALEGYLEPTQAIHSQDILTYAQDQTEPVNTESRVTLLIDGTLTYWDGAAWSTSDGTKVQTNTPSEISGNLNSLVIGTNSTILIRWHLYTTDSAVTPELESSTISYDFGALETSLVTCLVHGYYKDVAGKAVSGVSVVFSLSKDSGVYQEANSNIVENEVTTTTDATGYFEQALVRSSEYTEGGTYKVKLTKSGTTVSKNAAGTELSFLVPDADFKDITELLPSIP